MTCRTRRKASAYITSPTTSLTTSQNRLLVFGHPLNPEASIQVPADTIWDHEFPEDAAQCETREETGPHPLPLVAA